MFAMFNGLLFERRQYLHKLVTCQTEIQNLEFIELHNVLHQIFDDQLFVINIHTN